MAAQRAFHKMRACLVLLLLCLTEDQQASASETARSYYDTLNVEQTATDSQIKKSFRSLAVRYHPDKNKSAQAEANFREIAEAYAVLSDKKKRRLYDSVGHEAFLENHASLEDEDETSFHFSFSDFFHGFHDIPFMDEPHIHWSFLQEEEEEDIQYKHYSFEDSTFSFYFDDENEEQEEVNEATSVLSIYAHNIKVTEVLQDGDTLTFIIVSQKLSGTGEYHVDRTYDDFEWLQQHLYNQEDVPGIQGVIFPPLPARPQVNASVKVMKQLGFLSLGEWQPYSKALETFLRQVAAHSILSKNKAVEIFLTSNDPPGRQKVKKNLFNRLSQAVEELRKEGHKDVDEFFQTERDHNLVLNGHTRTATEKFLDVVLTEQKIAVACGHFAAALHLCFENGEDPEKKAFSRVCVKLSEVFDSMKKNMTSVAVNDMNTLGLGLDLDTRYQEAEKEMLFRRTCKLVELENARRNADRAKPVKKNAMEEVKKAAEGEFEQICKVAKQEIVRLNQEHVDIVRKSLTQWCEQRLQTAKEGADVFNQHLQAFKAMA